MVLGSSGMYVVAYQQSPNIVGQSCMAQPAILTVVRRRVWLPVAAGCRAGCSSYGRASSLPDAVMVADNVCVCPGVMCVM